MTRTLDRLVDGFDDGTADTLTGLGERSGVFFSDAFRDRFVGIHVGSGSFSLGVPEAVVVRVDFLFVGELVVEDKRLSLSPLNARFRLADVTRSVRVGDFTTTSSSVISTRVATGLVSFSCLVLGILVASAFSVILISGFIEAVCLEFRGDDPDCFDLQ